MRLVVWSAILDITPCTLYSQKVLLFQHLLSFIRQNADSVAQLLESAHPQAFQALQVASAGKADAPAQAGTTPTVPATATPKFCRCGHCSPASVHLERRCCRQEVGQCLTQTRRFRTVVLDDEVVRTAVNLQRHTQRDHVWSYNAAPCATKRIDSLYTMSLAPQVIGYYFLLLLTCTSNNFTYPSY